MINDIYALMHAKGLTRSRRDFSQRWLGCAPNYLADRRDHASPFALARLHSRLVAAGHSDLVGLAVTALLDAAVGGTSKRLPQPAMHAVRGEIPPRA